MIKNHSHALSSYPQSQRKKPELLSPAGTMECFFAAVENGADAVYLGLNDFSARASAENFSLNDASKAIAYAHERHIKVYIALNTLIKTSELDKIVDYLIALEELQPDAIILQDLGLLSLIQSQFPQFTVHASTQMAIHTIAGVKQLEKMGFKRIVLARELSMDEINHISQNTSAEIEVFIHGALCYSYSGLCFFSSVIGGRSGNRGRCAQPCRMYYKDQQNKGGYYFSMKDLLTLPYISNLIHAGVHSCKIEGRMKSPEYVAVVTHAYRQAIDGKLYDYDAAVHRIKTVFSRETTHSYLLRESDYKNEKIIRNGPVKAADMINSSYPANVGSYAGEVIKSEKGCLTIRADTEIGVRDLLQVFENTLAKPALLSVKTIVMKGKRVFSIKAGDIAAIPTEHYYRQGAKLYLLSSRKVHEMFSSKMPKKLAPSQIPADLKVRIRPDGISIQGVVQNALYTKDYPINLEKGIHKIIQEEDIKRCFSRSGETPFRLASMHADISGDLFVPLSILNDIRRDYLQNLSATWMKNREYRGKNIKEWIKDTITRFNIPNSNIFLNPPFLKHSPLPPFLKEDQGGFGGIPGSTTAKEAYSQSIISENEMKLSIKVDNLDYLNYIPLEKMYKIYILLTDKIFTNDNHPQPPFIQEKVYEIFTKRGLPEMNDKIIFSFPAIMRDQGNASIPYEHFKKILNELISQGFRQFQVSNLGAIGLFEGKDVLLYADYPLYCLNPLSAIKLKGLGFNRCTLSPEDDKDNLQKLFSPHTDIVIYQDIPLFISETCIWAHKKGTCPGKNRCNFKQVIVENEYGDKLIAMDNECKTIVIHEKPFSLIHYIPKFLEAGQTHFRVDLCYKDYTPDMIHTLFSKIQNTSKIKDSLIGNFERGLL